MTAALFLSMCSGCTRQYAVQGEPAGCEMPGDNGYTCPACRGALDTVTAVVPGRSYRLHDGWPASARWVVLTLSGGIATARRLGFPDSPELTFPASELVTR